MAVTRANVLGNIIAEAVDGYYTSSNVYDSPAIKAIWESFRAEATAFTNYLATRLRSVQEAEGEGPIGGGYGAYKHVAAGGTGNDSYRTGYKSGWQAARRGQPSVPSKQNDENYVRGYKHGHEIGTKVGQIKDHHDKAIAAAQQGDVDQANAHAKDAGRVAMRGVIEPYHAQFVATATNGARARNLPNPELAANEALSNWYTNDVFYKKHGFNRTQATANILDIDDAIGSGEIDPADFPHHVASLVGLQAGREAAHAAQKGAVERKAGIARAGGGGGQQRAGRAGVQKAKQGGAVPVGAEGATGGEAEAAHGDEGEAPDEGEAKRQETPEEIARWKKDLEKMAFGAGRIKQHEARIGMGEPGIQAVHAYRATPHASIEEAMNHAHDIWKNELKNHIQAAKNDGTIRELQPVSVGVVEDDGSGNLVHKGNKAMFDPAQFLVDALDHHKGFGGYNSGVETMRKQKGFENFSSSHPEKGALDGYIKRAKDWLHGTHDAARLHDNEEMWRLHFKLLGQDEMPGHFERKFTAAERAKARAAGLETPITPEREETVRRIRAHRMMRAKTTYKRREKRLTTAREIMLTAFQKWIEENVDLPADTIPSIMEEIISSTEQSYQALIESCDYEDDNLFGDE